MDQLTYFGGVSPAKFRGWAFELPNIGDEPPAKFWGSWAILNLALPSDWFIGGHVTDDIITLSTIGSFKFGAALWLSIEGHVTGLDSVSSSHHFSTTWPLQCTRIKIVSWTTVSRHCRATFLHWTFFSVMAFTLQSGFLHCWFIYFDSLFGCTPNTIVQVRTLFVYFIFVALNFLLTPDMSTDTASQKLKTKTCSLRKKSLDL